MQTMTANHKYAKDTITYDMVIPFLPDLFKKRIHVPDDESKLNIRNI